MRINKLRSHYVRGPVPITKRGQISQLKISEYSRQTQVSPLILRCRMPMQSELFLVRSLTKAVLSLPAGRQSRRVRRLSTTRHIRRNEKTRRRPLLTRCRSDPPHLTKTMDSVIFVRRRQIDPILIRLLSDKIYHRCLE